MTLLLNARKQGRSGSSLGLGRLVEEDEGSGVAEDGKADDD